MNDTFPDSIKDPTALAQAIIERDREDKMLTIFTEALKKTFDIEDLNGQKRFLDISRVPLICQSILAIDKRLENMENNMVNQDQFWPIKTLVYGMVATILVGALTAVLGLIFIK